MNTTCESSTFRLRYHVVRDVRAPADTVWGLLTDADAFPTWNTTVTEITGPIAVGTTLRIRVPISDRTFTPKVVSLDAPHRMVWQDGMMPMFQGTRTFTVTPTPDGCRFEMDEVFRGLMLPLIKGSLPDFAPVFDQYAADLKQAVEAR